MIKVELGIKIEILPVVYKQGTIEPSAEPFRLFRPEAGEWQDGYARYHEGWLTCLPHIGLSGRPFSSAAVQVRSKGASATVALPP